ncbi:MAG: GNAT family N-acetyltransferase [Nocardioides sp.]|nr:GNAT family N-acetyltransferase [Nocardioides sp.]
MQVRKLDVADLPHSRELGIEAFGTWPADETMPPLPTELPPGRHSWGAFEDGRLVARVVAHEYHSWWRGTQVPTCGVAGVAVAAEHRGGGLLTGLLQVLLREARERGEVLSTLYPTANGIYRGLGYELITSYDTVEVPTAELGRVTAPVGVRTRRATVTDLPAVRQVYDAWAVAQDGPLTRTGPRFAATDEEVLAEVTGITLAVDTAGVVTGFLRWDRGSGYGADAVLRVHDLIATDADSYRALWRTAGSFASVTGKVRLSTSGDDPARLVLPTMTWAVVGRHPYMLRVLDLPGAVAAISPRLAGGGQSVVDLAVVGDRLGILDGGYRITLGPGPAHAEPASVGPDVPTLTPQGLALLVAGAQSCGNLRLLSHLRGAIEHDDVLDAAFGGRQLHVRDYF